MNSHSQFRTSMVLTAMVVASFAVAIISLRSVDQIRSVIRPQEVLYLPSAKAAKRMSLGYTGLIADIYWTRAVQYFGGHHRHRSMDYHLLYPLLDITTQLDPHLIVAYRFGATFLVQRPPNGAGEPDKAVQLLEYGIEHNPNTWQLYYELGFLQAMDLHDYAAASKSFERGSKVPNAHPFLKILAAEMAQRGGDLQTARLLWQITLSTTDDKMIKHNAEDHLRALEVDEVVPKLEARIQTYHQHTGVYPASWLDLISAGYLRGIPIDPLGHPYKIVEDGTVEVQDPDALPFIEEGLPPGYKAKGPPINW